jgi:hypothetical protein
MVFEIFHIYRNQAMFDHHELQVLISGALVPVDIEDLKLHTNYSGKSQCLVPVDMKDLKHHANYCGKLQCLVPEPATHGDQTSLAILS